MFPTRAVKVNKKLVLGTEIGIVAVVLAQGIITVNVILGLGLGLQPAEAVDQDDESK
jgi:hypothetical protein